jgi:hypothetical protein
MHGRLLVELSIVWRNFLLKLIILSSSSDYYGNMLFYFNIKMEGIFDCVIADGIFIARHHCIIFSSCMVLVKSMNKDERR